MVNNVGVKRPKLFLKSLPCLFKYSNALPSLNLSGPLGLNNLFSLNYIEWLLDLFSDRHFVPFFAGDINLLLTKFKNGWIFSEK